jgi:hypothetical protein
MLGSLQMDCVPVFPVPEDLLDRRMLTSNHPSFKSALQRLRSQHGIMCDISDALISITDMADFINSNGNTHDLWTDDMVYVRKFLLIVHQALNLERRHPCDNLLNQDTECIREIFRLTCLLFLSLLKRRF